LGTADTLSFVAQDSLGAAAYAQFGVFAPSTEYIESGSSVTSTPGVAVAVTPLQVYQEGAFNGEAYTFTLSDSAGLITVGAGGGTAGVSGSGTTDVTLSGTLAAINDALDTVTLEEPTAASDSLVLSVVDPLGITASQTVPISSTPGQPTLVVPATLSVTTGVAFAVPALSFSEPGDLAGDVFTLQAQEDNGTGRLNASAAGGATITGDDSDYIIVTGSFAQVNAALGTLSITETAAGSDTLEYLVSDSDGNEDYETTAVTASGGSAPQLDGFLGDGRSDVLIQNSVGAVFVGEVESGQAQYTQVAGLGPEWSFVGTGDFLGDGRTDFLIENTNGAIDVGEVVNGQTQYTQVAALGPEWKFVETGDFLGDGKTDFLIENTAGGVVVGEVIGGQAQYTALGGLGPEWSFVGAGDYSETGIDSFLIENANGGALFTGTVVSGQAQYAQVGALGSEWKFHG
jgi:hypothetical protein